MPTASATRDATKVLAGVANCYFGPVGTALPADTVNYDADWGTGWTPFGFSEDGVSTEKNTDTDDVVPAEQITPVNVLVTGVNFITRLTMIESSLDFMKVAFGGATITTTAAGAGVAGKRTLVLSQTLDQYAIGFEVVNSLGFWTRFYVPKVLSVATVGTPFQLKGIRSYPIEFRAICKPSEVQIVDKTAAPTS